MIEVQAYTGSGEAKGRITLSEEVFGLPSEEHLIYEAIKAYLADQRCGLASTKKRSEVRGGGRKPFRQKGTGRARQGTRRSPLMPGGGITFGPKPRDHHIRLPRKIRRRALLSILSDRARDGRVCVIEKPNLSEDKTREIFRLLKTLGIKDERCLLILEKSEKEIRRAARNIPSLWVEEAKSLTAYPLVWAERVIVCEGAAERLKETFSP